VKVKLVVAHPDDCCIFGWPIVNLTKHNWDWSITYLTYNDTDPRAQEARNFWNQYNIKTTFLGFEDHYRDLEQGYITTFDEALAEESLIANLNKDCALIVTHNEDGEYGHIHHMFVHKIANKMPQPKIYFANDTNYTLGIRAPEFDLDYWPLHKEVIVGFTNRLDGKYHVTPEARANQVYL
jgi:LmbE family N-acetylglucosaminyl deacetylase|tara:strand:- start:246 stop:788 length:543 start_codon:yes stop_codon:yes gene_type:complete